MNKKAILYRIFTMIVLALLLITMFSGCGRHAEEKLSDEQALSAIRSYCYISKPELEDIVNAGEYPVYWDISSSDENEIVVLFRSYTGAQNRYYIDRITGDVYVTEFIPGISLEEERTAESFNVRDYSSGYDDAS